MLEPLAMLEFGVEVHKRPLHVLKRLEAPLQVLADVLRKQLR